MGEGLDFKPEEQGERRLLDIDSHSGTQVCQSYLGCIERLAVHALELELEPKMYRRDFSHSY